MKFSHQYLVSQIDSSTTTINSTKNKLERERKNLEEFLISQGYIQDSNVFIHPTYYEMRKRFIKEEGEEVIFPNWAVVTLP